MTQATVRGTGVSVLRRAPLAFLILLITLGTSVIVTSAAKLFVPMLNYKLTAGVVALAVMVWLVSLLKP